MRLVSWAIAILITLTIFFAVTATVIASAEAMSFPQLNFALPILYFLGLYFSTFLVHWFFDFVNFRVDPKWRLSLDSKTIPPEHSVWIDGEYRDRRYQKGWRLWLMNGVIIAFVIYALFYYD